MIVLIRGGGDLASGVALRLHRCGLHVVVTELSQPLAVRRLVSFAEAVYTKACTVEGVEARLVSDWMDSLSVLQVFSKGRIPVLVDPDGKSAQALHPMVIVDARMRKCAPEPMRHNAVLYMGLGPGFVAGENCHVVIETNRGHSLGRVIWQGAAQSDTGVPEAMGQRQAERVLRAPADGVLTPLAQLGDSLEAGQPVFEVAGQVTAAPFTGVLRGLLHPSVPVHQGMKVGDLDPRGDPGVCTQVSDKALAVGGAVLEALLSRPELRKSFWS